MAGCSQISQIRACGQQDFCVLCSPDVTGWLAAGSSHPQPVRSKTQHSEMSNEVKRSNSVASASKQSAFTGSKEKTIGVV